MFWAIGALFEMSAKVRLSGKPVFFHLRLAAPFSSRIRARAEMRHASPLLNSIIKHIVVTADGKLALVKNSKAGSTTAAQILFAYQNGTIFDGRVHSQDSGLIQGGNHIARVRAALDDSRCFKFSFVRQPERRIVSAFADFVVKKSNPTAFRLSKYFKGFGIEDGNDSPQNFSRFLDYVEEGMRQSDLYSDRHFRPQVLNLGIGEVRYNRIGKLESFAADMEEILKDAGVWREDLRAKLEVRANRTAIGEFTPDAAQTARIKRIYAADYDAFGY